MENKFLRLFVTIAKLMAAEKMKLEKFCQHGEYLAYTLSISPTETLDENIKFMLTVDVGEKIYTFTHGNIDINNFDRFESELSVYLNVLFDRKQEFEKQNKTLQKFMDKVLNDFTPEEKKFLATHIDANTDSVLRMLGVNN